MEGPTLPIILRVRNWPTSCNFSTSFLEEFVSIQLKNSISNVHRYSAFLGLKVLNILVYLQG
jgi:hypothetical protein